MGIDLLSGQWLDGSPHLELDDNEEEDMETMMVISVVCIMFYVMQWNAKRMGKNLNTCQMVLKENQK